MTPQEKKLFNAAKNLSLKLDECKSAIDNAFAFVRNHGGYYNGPDYGIEHEKLKEILEKYKGEK